MTVFRIVIAPVVAGLIWLDSAAWGYHLALILFVLGAVSDFLDGWMARRLSIASRFGTMLDPIADKVIVALCLLALAAASQGGWLFFVPATVILFREFLISGIREFMAGREVDIPVSAIAKWKTACQLVAIGVLIGARAFPQLEHVEVVGLVTLWLAAIISAQTGITYFRGCLRHV